VTVQDGGGSFRFVVAGLVSRLDNKPKSGFVVDMVVWPVDVVCKNFKASED
jgi:hypothetical protein